jgi:hypothetical protein
MTDIIVTMQHARAAKLVGEGVLCASGIRAWCARHDIDLRRFTQEGLPIGVFETIDDAFAKRLVAVARHGEVIHG